MEASATGTGLSMGVQTGWRKPAEAQNRSTEEEKTGRGS